MHPHARALSSCLRSTLPRSSAPRGCHRSMPCSRTRFQLVSVSSALRHSPCPAMPCRGAHEREREGHTRGTREREGGRGRGGAGNRLLRYGRRWSSENWRRSSCRRRHLDRRARREQSHFARTEPSQPAEYQQSAPPLSSVGPIGHRCLPATRERAHVREAARERQHTRGRESRRQLEREGARADFLHEVLVQRPPFPFLSLSSSVRAEPKRESGDESESARERGGTSRRQRERGGTRERGAGGGIV